MNEIIKSKLQMNLLNVVDTTYMLKAVDRY